MLCDCHVLIIEDEPLIAMLLHDILEDEGVNSFAFAHTQEDAVASALSHRPDLITSDVKLIQGTGPVAVDEIRHQLGDIPVIFVTATPNECRPCAPPGQILRKPVDEGELLAVVHAIMPRQAY